MEVFVLYALICYAFTLGAYIEVATRTKVYVLTPLEIAAVILSPILLPIFIGMESEEKSNK